MLGDVLAEGATIFGDRSGNISRRTPPSQPEVSGCSMKRSYYFAAIVVMLVMLLGLGRRQGKQAKDSHSSGGYSLSGGDVGAGINRLVVAKAVDILPIKVSQGLVWLISRFVALFSNSIPSNSLGGFLWRHFVVITLVIVRPLFGGEAGILIVVRRYYEGI